MLQRCQITTATNGPLAVTSWWIATVYSNKRKCLRSFGVDAEGASPRIDLGFSFSLSLSMFNVFELANVKRTWICSIHLRVCVHQPKVGKWLLGVGD